MFAKILWLVGLSIAGATLWMGFPYYLTPIDERPFSPLDELFSPTGLVGHGYGIIGTLLVVVGVSLYTARKRLRILAGFGKLSDWLNFHIFLCLLGPYLVLLHTTFKFGGFVAISFWSMAVVVASGVFGRYVYAWIPKTISGSFLGAKEIRERMQSILLELEANAGLSSGHLLQILRPSGEPAGGSRSGPPLPPPPPPSPPQSKEGLQGMARSVQALFEAAGSAQGVAVEDVARAVPHAEGRKDQRKRARPDPDRRSKGRQPGIFRAIGEAVAFRLGRRRERARFNRELSAAGVPKEARTIIVQHLDEESKIEQQLRILQPFQRAFRYWHAFHLPLAAVMFLVLAGHVAVALMFGYTWIF